MFKTIGLMLIFVILGSSGTILAAEDRDNNGVPGDESFSDPVTFQGESNCDNTIIFPTSADTWIMTYYPYWWNTGDTVFGVHDMTEDGANHAEITLNLTRNSLISGGYCDIDFRIDGVTVGSFQILPEHGLGPINESFDFNAHPAGTYELRYFETNTVLVGYGSVDMDESGTNSVVFSVVSSLESSTWGMIKSAYL